ncbi:MAG: hypothetical protein ACRD0Y_02755 [Terriglobales bacterium]
MRALQWAASILAVLAMIFLPALTAKSPLTSPRQWTIGTLGAEAVHLATGPRQPGRPSLKEIIHKAQALNQEFGGRGASPRLRRAITLAALIPVAAVIAGLCALLSLLWLALRIGWLYWLDALIGLIACAYAIIAGWLLTRAAQSEMKHLLSRLQHGLGGLLHGLSLRLPPQLQSSVGVVPEVGLYVLGLLFVAMLILPRPRAGSRASQRR